MSDQRPPLRVGYILKQYPRLSETFILNEILGLEEAGVDVSIYSLRHATEGRFHPAIASVQGTVRYLGDPTKTTFLDALRALPNLRTEQLPAALDFLDQLPAERRPRLALQAIEIANAAQRTSIGHIHAHFMTVAAHTAHLVHLLTGLPYTVTAHAKDIYRHTVDWELAARIATTATAVVTVCDANLRHLQDRLDGAAVHLTRIYNGLDLGNAPSCAASRSEGLVLAVGRLVEKKGFDLLLHTIAELRPHRHDLRCVIIGDGDQSDALHTLAARLNVADRVTFTGSLPQNEVNDWMQRAEVIVAPCRVGTDGNQDALPTVLLEALRAGLPAIATPVAGIPEIITHGSEGLIVDCDDVGALTRATASLLDNPTLRTEMSHAGPIKLATHFDRRGTIRSLIDVFAPSAVVS